MRPFPFVAVPLALAAAPASAAEPIESGQVGSPVERASARAFVDAITVPIGGQVARFHEPLCPLSRGLPTDYNEVVEERVRTIARGAGIPVARRRQCLPNLIVMVANDGDAVTALLRRERPDIFSGLESIDIRRAIDAAGPVRSWQSSVTRRAEGAPIADSRDSSLAQDVHLHHGLPAGLMREPTRRDLRLAVVLFSVDAIDGLTLMQIADHAAMRGLAATRPAPDADGRSILALFDDRAAGRAAVPSATRWDVAYLRALYRLSGAANAGFQRSSVARLIAEDLAENPAR